MNKYCFLLLSVAAVVGVGCNSGTPDSTGKNTPVAMVYFGGDIITMEGDSAQYAEALVVKDGKITFVGNKVAAMEAAGNGHQMIDLKGHTLLPGFFDGHAHFFGFGAQAVTANLLASPDGTCDNIPNLITTMKAWTRGRDLSITNGWIAGMGFDDAVLKENRFPTRHELDLIAKDTPVVAIHISAHFCVMNTKGLEVCGITAASPNPEGGLIRREKDGKTPNGVLEELAAIPLMTRALSPATPDQAFYFLEEGQKLAASFGHTSVQEGRAMAQQHNALASFAKAGRLKLDVAGYIDYTAPELFKTEWYGNTYKNHYRIAGIKLTLDGSPQGRTGWRHAPYLLPPDGQAIGYKGYPAIPSDASVKAIVGQAYGNNWQILIHANGDAAIDQMLTGIRYASEKYGGADRRSVLIHGQFIRPDQLDSLKKFDVVASLFPMHTFYWGDWYKKIIGPEKAKEISPINSALKKGLHVTSHTDAPVAFPNMMMILWTTVNRVSRSGTVMGEGERLTTYQALQCITSWSAWQHFEEKSKGTLTAGKLADMVILDQNPLKIDPMKLKDIQVMETIKDGVTVFKKS
ncbi:MAG: amidohydrolase [Chitinophagaceae bacterium]|nr:amidohydrolase [Chitinophagaceae bacterium]